MRHILGDKRTCVLDRSFCVAPITDSGCTWLNERIVFYTFCATLGTNINIEHTYDTDSDFQYYCNEITKEGV